MMPPLALATTLAQSDAEITSILDFVVKGGPVMIPIGACSLIALAVAAERLLSLRRARVIPPAFLPGLQAALSGAGTDRRPAIDFCAANPSPVAAVFAAGIRRLGEPAAAVERAIEDAGRREVLSLRKRLRLLAVIASITPLLGLLGTIFGMIRAFQTVAASGEALGRTELLARGIYEAMITTAAGLIVAIPTLLFYNWIVSRIEALVAQIDRMAAEFVEDYALPPAPRVVPLTEAKPGPHLNGEAVAAIGSHRRGAEDAEKGAAAAEGG